MWVCDGAESGCLSEDGSDEHRLDKQIYKRKIVNMFLPIIFSICFGQSKEPSR